MQSHKARRPTVFIRKLLPKVWSDFERTSFIGGKPLMPRSLAWPHRKPLKHEYPAPAQDALIPMHFICQIDCSQIPEFEDRNLLPSKGILYFFYALDLDGICVLEGLEPFWRVVYCSPDAGPLERREIPLSLGAPMMGGARTERRILFSDDRTLSKELGYVPIEFVVGLTTPDPVNVNQADRETVQALRQTRRAVLDQFIGPEREKPPVDQPSFPATVLHAHSWIYGVQRSTDRTLLTYKNLIKNFDAGIRKAHYNHTEERWQELAKNWKRKLPIISDCIEELTSLSKALIPFRDIDSLPQELAEDFRSLYDKLAGILEMQDYMITHESSDILARGFLSTHYPLCELNISPNEMDWLNYQRGKRAAESHIFGFADEEQSDSSGSAFNYAMSMGWTKPGDQPSDLILLLQLDTCGSSGMMWGDMGKAYFYIREEDLLAGRFDRVSHCLDGG